MNKIMIAAAAVLLIMNSASAQHASVELSKDNNNRNEIVVHKGYYSIHKNSKKLNTSRPPSTVQLVTGEQDVNTHRKGFYAIGDNHRDVHRGGKSFIAITPKRPTASKGYYSVHPQADEVNSNNLPDEMANRKSRKMVNIDSVKAEAGNR